MAARSIFLGLLALLPGAAVAAPGDGLAPTPPMGWSTWYGLRCDYDAKTLVAVADSLVARGLKDAGYQYLNVDDCWVTGRSPTGELVADAARFPGGMSAVGREIHARGLKFGLYTSAGNTTCQRDLQADGSRVPAGSRGREYQDMATFASWGVDYAKVDWCGRYDTQDSRSSFETFRDAIKATGRPMVLSICEWGRGEPWTWGKQVGHLWRIGMDVLNCWSCTTDWGGMGVALTFDLLDQVGSHGGPGGWSDPDNLQVGNGVLTPDEGRAQMSVYAVMAAPLIIAADPRRLSAEDLATLANRDVIAINQDALGKPGRRVRKDGSDEVWVRPLSDGSIAVLLFNRGPTTRDMSMPWTEVGWPLDARVTGRELWRGGSVKESDRGLAARVPPHGAALYRLRRIDKGATERPAI